VTVQVKPQVTDKEDGITVVRGFVSQGKKPSRGSTLGACGPYEHGVQSIFAEHQCVVPTFLSEGALARGQHGTNMSIEPIVNFARLDVEDRQARQVEMMYIPGS